MSNRGISRHSIDFPKGKFGENSTDESEGEQEEEVEYSDGDIKEVHHCLRDQQHGFAKNTVMMC